MDKKVSITNKINKLLSKVLLFSFLVLPASSNFKLEGFSFGNAGGGQVGSSNYGLVGNMGELSSNKVGSSNYDLGAGLAFIRQSSVPGVPTLINDGNFYNKLKLILNNTYLSNGSTAFPSASVLDDFNRTDGGLGGVWNGNTGTFSISSNRLRNDSDGFIIYDPGSTFGTGQEAFITFTQLSADATEQDLLLKSQSNNTFADLIEVLYDNSNKLVQIWTSTAGSWNHYNSDVGVSFVNGDVMGARVDVAGAVSVYKNGSLIGEWDVSSWVHISKGGYIGMWIIGATDSPLYDDFGGGNSDLSGSSLVEMPSDTKFAVAISEDNWATTNYVKSDMTVGSTLAMTDYQTYSVWGGASGVYIVGLGAGTTYAVKVKSMQGQYTESGYGVAAFASTESPTLSFDIDVAATDVQTTPPYIVNFGDLFPGSLATSTDKVWISFETNATSGGSVFVYGQNSGLYSLSAGYTIPTVSGNLAGMSTGFGIQAVGSTQASGGPLEVDTLYSGAGDVVGLADTLVRQLLVSTNPVTSGRASFLVKAKSDNQTEAASDYTETLTIIGAANY